MTGLAAVRAPQPTKPLASRMQQWLAVVGAPEWVRIEIGKANGEAAGYRVRLRAAEAALTGSEARVRQLEAELFGVMSELEGLRVADARRAAIARHRLPEAVAIHLRGDTPEAIAEDARHLAEAGISWVTR